MAEKVLQYEIQLLDNMSKGTQKAFEKIQKDYDDLRKHIGAKNLNIINEQQLEKEMGLLAKAKRQYADFVKEIRKPLSLEQAFHKATQIGIPGLAIKKAVDQASTIQYGMANIEKVLPRATKQEIRNLKTEIDDMVRKIPKAKEDIIAAYQVAVQSLPMSDVKEYITNVEQMSVAFDMNPQEVSRSMMFIKKNLELGGSGMKDFGDQVAYMHHHFGNALVPQIIEATSRMSGLGKMVGLTKEQMLGLSVLSLESGVDVSRTSNAIQRGMISRLGSLAGTKKGVAGLQALGIDSKQFEAAFKKDKFSAFIQLLEKVDSMSRKGIDVTKPLQNLIGLHYYDVVAQLASKVDILKHSYADLATTTKWVGEASAGYEKILNTQHSKTIMLSESYKNLKEQLGTHLLPAVSSITDGLKDFNYGLADIVKNAPIATKVIAALTAAVIALRAAKLALQAASWIGLVPGGKYAKAGLAFVASLAGAEYAWNKKDKIKEYIAGDKQKIAMEPSKMIADPLLKRTPMPDSVFSRPNVTRNIEELRMLTKQPSTTTSTSNQMIRQQKGALDIIVHDNRTEVKPRGGDYQMDVRQQDNGNWLRQMGNDFRY